MTICYVPLDSHPNSPFNSWAEVSFERCHSFHVFCNMGHVNLSFFDTDDCIWLQVDACGDIQMHVEAVFVDCHWFSSIVEGFEAI